MEWSPVAGSLGHALWACIAYFKQVELVLVSCVGGGMSCGVQDQPMARSWLCVMRISHHLSIARLTPSQTRRHNHLPQPSESQRLGT